MKTLSPERLQAIREQNQGPWQIDYDARWTVKELLEHIEELERTIERLRGALSEIRDDLGWTVALLYIEDAEAQETLTDCLRDTQESCVAALRGEAS